MSWKKEKFSSLLSESKIPCETPDSNKRIRVRLNVKGVEKRPDANDKKGATKQYVRKAGQFIYGKQNFHKGAFGIIPPELDGFETSADIPSFDVREDCLPEWIYYFFKAGNRYLELTKYARGVGSKRIHPKQIADLEIPLPPINIQKQVIEELKIIEKDEISTALSHQLTLVKKLRQSFLREAMQGKLTEDWRTSHPELVSGSHSATKLLAKIKAEKEQLIKGKKLRKQKPLPPISEEEIPFEIPGNWAWCRLGKITQSMTNGIYKEEKFYNDDGIGCFRMYNISDGKINFDKLKRMELTDDEIERYLLTQNDLLLNRVNSVELLGKSGLLPFLDKPYVFESKNIRITLFEKSVIAPYVNYLFLTPLIKDQILKSFKKVTGQASISQEKLNPLLIPLPPLSEQKRIVAKLEELMAYCDSLEESIKNSQTQNEMLLGQVLREALEPKEKEVVV